MAWDQFSPIADAHGPLTSCVFPQFSHACDGPGLSMLCFMRRDILEYFSIYGTALSMWVSLMGEWLSLPVGGGGEGGEPFPNTSQHPAHL